MFHRRNKSAVLFLFLFLFSSGVFGFQTQSNTGKYKVNKSTFSKVPFDTSVVKLPTNYLGHDFERIYKILNQRTPSNNTNNEFETSEQYQNRLFAQYKKPILESLDINSLFAFKPEKCESKYNADRKVLTVSLFISAPFNKGFNLKYEEKAIGSYLGTNAYGATRKIDQTEITWYQIAIDNLSYLNSLNEESAGLSEWYFVNNLSIEPTLAMKLKQSLQALFICKLSEPYVSEEQMIKSATFDSPTFERTYYYFLHADVIEIIFYDYSTGEIIKRVK